jgi:uncharacterized membrane protein
MKTSQNGFTMATTVLLGFTIVIGAWFVLTHSGRAVLVFCDSGARRWRRKAKAVI